MRASLTGFDACCVYVVSACLLLTALCADYGPIGTASPPSAKIIFDLDKGHAVTETLWGIFFEEVRLQAELICCTCEAALT